MDIKKMTNERLISDHESRFIGGGKCWVTRDELLRRLEEGEKAIEQVKEFEAQFRKIMDEPCEKEAHCTCVPFLRKKEVYMTVFNGKQMKKPNGYNDRTVVEFIGYMEELLLAPDTNIRKSHMKTAISIIKKYRNAGVVSKMTSR